MKQLFFICLLHFLSAQSFREFTEAKLREFYPNAIDISFKHYSITKTMKVDIEQTVKQAFFRDNLYTWKITSADSSVYYAILDNVLGKVQPITFLVVFSKTHTIEFVEILKYREAYGGEISRQSFLDQFSGATDKSELKKGDDIKNISGATISVNALTRGVKKLNLLFPAVKDFYAQF
jgi:Na+-translocating ferredoxin:NAD+ oxidoreductase RnfG subunit